MVCIFCFENNDNYVKKYKCNKNCFFNNQKECKICYNCLSLWLELNINENHKYEKCPICSNWSLKNTDRRCIECICDCKIKYNRIYPHVLNENINKKCKHILKNIICVLFIYIILIVLGFCISNLWYYCKYNKEEFQTIIKNDKWKEIEYYLLICPGITIIIMVISIILILFCKCLENIC